MRVLDADFETGVHANAMRQIVIIAMSLVMSCVNETPQTSPPERMTTQQWALESNGNLVVATLSLSSTSAAPGTDISVTVQASATESTTVSVYLDDELVDVVEMTVYGDMIQGKATVTVGQLLGDHELRVEGELSTGSIYGAAIIHVTDSPLNCASKEVLENGQCGTAVTGHRLILESVYRVAALDSVIFDKPGEGHRITVAHLHPRAIAPVGDGFVACHTATVATATSMPKQCPLNSVKESMYDISGMKVCDYMALDKKRMIAVTTTRGTYDYTDTGHEHEHEDDDGPKRASDGGTSETIKGPGGMSTWIIPVSSDGELGTPKFADSHIDEAGFQQVVLVDNYAYVAKRDPAGLGIFCIGDDGSLEDCGHLHLDDMGPGWAIAADGDRLYLTDVGVHFHEDQTPDHDHDPGDSRLYIIDISERTKPKLLGQTQVGGHSNGLAVLPDNVLAIALGNQGLQLVDTTDPQNVISLWTEDTPGTTIRVAYKNGYLAAADWLSFRLYDASEKGYLRLLDAVDYHPRDYPAGDKLNDIVGESSCLADARMDAAAFVTFADDGTLVAADIDRGFRMSVRPFHDAPRAILQEHTRYLGAEEPPVEVAFGITNAGRKTLEIKPNGSTDVTPTSGNLMIAPGATDVLTYQLNTVVKSGEKTVVTFDSNEPGTPTHSMDIVRLAGHYNIGDPAPSFAMPLVTCNGPDCQATMSCFDTEAPEWEGKPIVLVFFASY